MSSGRAVQIVELKDNGQDFTELHLDRAGRIVETRPFQGWVWNGYVVEDANRLEVGSAVVLTGKGSTITLRHKVAAIRKAAGQ